MPPAQTLVRVLILAWLITWVATVPLFHIHVPDSTDRWSALKSGGVHTIFTADLPGEYSHPFHDSERGHSRHLSQRGVNSPELAIAFFDEPDDRKVKVPHAFEALFQLSQLSQTSLLLSDAYAFPETYRQLQLYQSWPASRAPPLV